jgi:sugar phosphate isomerase/epimerase
MRIKGISTGMYGWQERYWREGKDAEWAELFRDCAQAGVAAVEIDPFPEVAELAAGYGLSVSASYVGLPLHEPLGWSELEDLVLPVAERLARAGGSDLLINADPKGGWGAPERKTEDEFKRQGEQLTRIADAVRSFGLNVCMHNHAADRHNAEGDLRSVIEYAAPDVGLCIDTGWAHAAGIDPLQWIRQYPGRVYAFHLRNQQSAVSAGSIPTANLAEGDIDMRGIVMELAALGYSGWLGLELLQPPEPPAGYNMIEQVKTSIDYLNRLMKRENAN